MNAKPEEATANMEDLQPMDPEFVEAAEGYETLGPNYFAARKAAETFMASFTDEMFKPLIDKFAEQLADEMWTRVASSLLSDTEGNLQMAIHGQIDGSVRALLSGEPWALRQYALGPRYDCDAIRAAVAKHVPKELQDARIVELEAEVERLKEQINFLQRYR